LFFETTSQGLIVRIRLQPNASACSVNGCFSLPDGSEYLKISIISVPEKGKANQELIAWLAKKLKIAKSDIKIVSGELDRYKKLLITDKSDHIIPLLTTLAQKEKTK
jgi:hypothetical protein